METTILELKLGDVDGLQTLCSDYLKDLLHETDGYLSVASWSYLDEQQRHDETTNPDDLDSALAPDRIKQFEREVTNYNAKLEYLQSVQSAYLSQDYEPLLHHFDEIVGMGATKKVETVGDKEYPLLRMSRELKIVWRHQKMQQP